MTLVRVDPGDLHLPPARRAGADLVKLSTQIVRFGGGTDGMLPPQVTRCANGRYMIIDRVTRATRIAKLRPGATIIVEVIDERPSWVIDRLPKVRETL